MLEDALNILRKIDERGYESYIVGGYVRDRLLGIDSTDFDICTSAEINDIKDLFDNALIDERFGSLKVYINDNKYEITSFRKDIEYLDNRRPSKIEHVISLSDDLLRRDFTINTICMDKNENIIDLMDGKKDLEDKIIRTVGSVDKKLEEDSLRILRAIRFATTLNFKIDDDLSTGIIKYSKNLSSLSFERRKYELEKIFESPNYLYGIKMLNEHGLLEYLGIEIESIIKTDLIGMWAQIKYDDRYPISKKDKKTIDEIREIINYKKIDNITVYYYSKKSNYIASDILKIDRKTVDNLIDSLQIKSRSDIVLSISDISIILNKKIEEIKDLYNSIEKKIVLNELKNDKDEIINYIKRGE